MRGGGPIGVAEGGGPVNGMVSGDTSTGPEVGTWMLVGTLAPCRAPMSLQVHSGAAAAGRHRRKPSDRLQQPEAVASRLPAKVSEANRARTIIAVPFFVPECPVTGTPDALACGAGCGLHPASPSCARRSA